MNLQECLRRKAITNGLEELFFFVSEAKKYDAIEKPEVEAILNHALVRYLVHHLHHLKSPFSLPEQEAKFATILKATSDFFFSKFAENEELLAIFRRTAKLLAKFCEDLHEKELSLPNLVTLFAPLARHNAKYIYRKVDVAKVTEFLKAKVPSELASFSKEQLGHLLEIQKALQLFDASVQKQIEAKL